MPKIYYPPVSRSERFLELYLKTGNGTESAMQIFKCKSRQSAQVVGSIYLKRLRPFIRMILEQKGYTYGKMLDVAIEKMYESKKTDWWDRLAKIGGYVTT